MPINLEGDKSEQANIAYFLLGLNWNLNHIKNNMCVNVDNLTNANG